MFIYDNDALINLSTISVIKKSLGTSQGGKPIFLIEFISESKQVVKTMEFDYDTTRDLKFNELMKMLTNVPRKN